MENNEFEKVRIKNRTCYYFDDIIKLGDFDFSDILIDEKSHENNLICYISYKTLIVPKPMRIRFHQIDGVIKIYGRTKYLVLLGPEKYDAIYNRIRYLISLQSGIPNVFSHYHAKIKVDSFDYLPMQNRLTLHNVTIFIKSVLNKDKNLYY